VVVWGRGFVRMGGIVCRQVTYRERGRERPEEMVGEVKIRRGVVLVDSMSFSAGKRCGCMGARVRCVHSPDCIQALVMKSSESLK
jgi:hypothetical protein